LSCASWCSGWLRHACCLCICFLGWCLETGAETLHWGPFHATLGLQAGVSYTDNVKTSQTNEQGDIGISFGPVVNAGLSLPIITSGREELMTVSTSLGFSYKRYLRRGQASNFNSPIGFTLTLPLHVQEWLVNVNDSFRFTNDPLESALAVSVTTVEQYSNTASISGMRRFGRFALTLAAQRSDKWAPSMPSTEESINSFSITPSVFLQENFSVFWANSIGFVFPEDLKTRSNGINMTSTIGVAGQITPVLSGSIGVGYVHSEFDSIVTATGPQPGGKTDGVSANVGLSYAHPLRPNTAHSISLTYSPGVTATLNNSNFQTSYGGAYTIAHRLNAYLTLSPQVSWMRTISEGGLSHSEMDMMAVQIALSRSFGSHLSGTINCRHQETSGQTSYKVNIISLQLNYMF